ncbi:MAG: alpha/beta hydrolase fold domain-containing protein, partial [Marinomonas sp.]
YDDALASVTWAKANASDINIDADRIALAGDSAGGNLAAAAARTLAGDPAIRHQLLIYPALDASCASPSFATEQAGFLSSAQMRWYWDQYAPDELASDPSASPSLGAVEEGTAPATIILAGNDPLHDEGAEYAKKLRSVGIAAVLHDYPGAIHGFASFVGMVPVADEAVATGAAALRASFDQ